MTEQEKLWFDAITNCRSESASMLAKPSMQGIRRSVVDKYSDQAHFVYELLQNADDVKATYIQLRLQSDGLYFIHNGTVHFTISNPDTEEEDSKQGTLGHINAITSIANSNKTSASIGKFGVGFKSVYQYTDSPYIYDPKVRFRIENFIVPTLEPADTPIRKQGQTVFWLPFNHRNKTPIDSYNEIADKLVSLDMPLLFMSNITGIAFQIEGKRKSTGRYTKQITDHTQHGTVLKQRVSLEFNCDNMNKQDCLIVFSEHKGTHRYCVGYSIDRNGQLAPISRPAFCFFPTKESTGLNFVVHAPFLLTDSREGIKAGDRHNQEMVELLAHLTARTLSLLRDESLINDEFLGIIPYNESHFTEIRSNDKLSFKPFFLEIKRTLQNSVLLPADNGKYVSKCSAFWAYDQEIVQLFSNEQLSMLTGTENASWVFRSRSKKELLAGNKALADYIDGGDMRAWPKKEPNLIVASLEPETLLKKISPHFIASQSEEWLHVFYGYLSERVSYHRWVKDRPIFLNQIGKPVAAFDSKSQPILFLPDEIPGNYDSVKPSLLGNQKTRLFLSQLGIKEANLRDLIYNCLLPQYDSGVDVDAKLHFTQFFRYFKECRNEEVKDFVDLIKSTRFLLCRTEGDKSLQLGRAYEIYFPTPQLKEWFEPTQDALFLDLDTYRDICGRGDEQLLMRFFNMLGVSDSPRVKKERQSLDQKTLKALQLTTKGHHHLRVNNDLHGCKAAIQHATKTRSLVIWNLLAPLINDLRGQHEWFHYSQQREPLESDLERLLKTSPWLLDRSGNLTSPEAADRQSLSSIYAIDKADSKPLLDYLGIKDGPLSTSHLSAEELRKVRLAEQIERFGLSEDEIRKALEDAKASKQGAKEKTSTIGRPPEISREVLRHAEEFDDMPVAPASVERAANLGRWNESIAESPEEQSQEKLSEEGEQLLTDRGAHVQRLEQRLNAEIKLCELQTSLMMKASSSPKYSFAWFQALLQLELLACNKSGQDRKTISVRFSKLRRDENGENVVILSEPSCTVPSVIEELSGVPVHLTCADGTVKSLVMESFTLKQFVVLGRVSSVNCLEKIDLPTIVQARVEVQNPTFLMQEWWLRYQELQLESSFNLKKELPKNIEFVFGPPGTGKTTHLAERVILPLMQEPIPLKVLVLAPTNKAADVIAMRLISVMNKEAVRNCLIRFGSTTDQSLQEVGIVKQRSFEFKHIKRAVVVTTIARFAYDGFLGGPDQKLCNLDWDVIVFDEASMIPLFNIALCLFRQKPKRFVVAGDPFQIEPIVDADQWRDENIYSLVGLTSSSSFVDGRTEPHDFPILRLGTQFRSVPAVGHVFNQFTYGGKLRHFRKTSDRCFLRVNGIEIPPLNVIRFPVSEHEGVYRSKRMESGTPYHIYSALLTFEWLRFISTRAEHGFRGTLRIGVVAPYRAQASLLFKLVDSWKSRPALTDIQVGTIHGFQGDECDIVIALFNPPPGISGHPQMFLNRQNILNVAISRARDYLFLVAADGATEGIDKLQRLSLIQRIARDTGECREFSAKEIEMLIWGNSTYLEENTYLTGHQLVNVYHRPERYYEVRCDEHAIDVQVHQHLGEQPNVSPSETSDSRGGLVERMSSFLFGRKR